MRHEQPFIQGIFSKKQQFLLYVSLFLLTESICLIGTLEGSTAEDTQDELLFEQLYNQDDADETEALIEEDELLNTHTHPSYKPISDNPYEGYVIHEVKVEGNTSIATEALLHHIPYKTGMIYTQTPFIKELYQTVKQLRHIKVMLSSFDKEMVDIVVQVQEKTRVNAILIEQNDHLNSKDILKAINAEKLVAVDQEELELLALNIKALYKEKGYLSARVTPTMRTENNDHTVAVFTIQEGRRSHINKISFQGNNNISTKELRTVLHTKEAWLLSFLDKTGSYHEERAKYGDTQMIEQLYQNRGFLYAKVVRVEPIIDDSSGAIELLFVIHEGDRYIFSDITAEETEEFDTDRLIFLTGLVKGAPYCREAITNAIKRLESMWAHQGYIFTHVDPVIIPNEKEKTVSVHFNFEKGKKVTVNRVNIEGNVKTNDKVIRRKVVIEEGEHLTQAMLNQSKQNVQALGYFDQRDGVSWKIKPIDEENVDVDLMVKEAKTGSFALNLAYGGNKNDMSSALAGFTVKLDYSNINFAGSGIHLNSAVSWAKEEQAVLFHIAQPWLFDKPILGALDVYHKRPSYDEIRHLQNGPVNEMVTGGGLTTGYILHSDQGLFHDTQLLGSFGIEHIQYQKQPLARPFSSDPLGQRETVQFQSLLNRSFTAGEYAWLSCNLEQDMRTHPFHPKEGHRWKCTAKVGIPTFDHKIGFYKLSFDAHWYTTLIDEYDVILHTHTFAGLASPLKDHAVPFAELFHIGGAATVRGFRFGEVGPKFLNESGIGAQKALFMNVELLFPITADYSMRGVLFYDGGTGWDNPYVHTIDNAFITGNGFDYRHSVGVGIRLTSPVPVRVDWGFKIDPRRDREDRTRDENVSEVHFSMSYDW